MGSGHRYALTVWLLGAAVYGVATHAHLQAIALFGGPAAEEKAAAAPASPHNAQAAPAPDLPPLPAGVRVASALAGANAIPAATLVAKRPAEGGADRSAPAGSAAKESNDWVEVTSAVNMRGGPSSASPVIKSQHAGARLRVLGRQGVWVHVAEPETGRTGWVFRRYVTAAPAPALASETTRAAVR